MLRPEGNAFVKRHAMALWKQLGEEGVEDDALVVAMAPEDPVHDNNVEFYPGVILCLWSLDGMWKGK
jgi:hypothetical protein